MKEVEREAVTVEKPKEFDPRNIVGENTPTPAGAMTFEQYQALHLPMAEKLARMEALIETHEKWFNENEKAHVEMKKETKTVLNSTAAAFVFVAIAFAGLAFGIMMSNKKLVEHAEAINNNSYSIESIITSIKGGPAVD